MRLSHESAAPLDLDVLFGEVLARPPRNRLRLDDNLREDTFQDACVDAMRGLSSFNPSKGSSGDSSLATFRRWFSGIQYHRGAKNLRQRTIRQDRQGEQQVHFERREPACSPSQDLELLELETAINEELRALRYSQRRLLDAFLQGIPVSAIARKHGIEESSVRSGVARARRALWDRLHERGVL